MYHLMRSAIAAAYERGTWDERNCHTFFVLKGSHCLTYKDCLTVDYAEVNVRDGYKMMVRFSGPKSESSELNYVCEGGRGYSNVYFNGERGNYQKALRDQDAKMFTRCLDHLAPGGDLSIKT
jgi:hypothetical protein